MALVPERTQEAREKVLLSWGKEVCSGIVEVSMDLWRPYQSLMKKLMPAPDIVADRFHVMQKVQEELNNQRKQVKKEVNKMANSAEKTAKLNAINNSKFALLTNRENLNEAQKSQRE